MQMPRVSTRIWRKTRHWVALNSTFSCGHGASA
jgi:hypothetical protein